MTNQIEVQRIKAGLTQRALGRPLGWTQTRISNYERGRRTPDVDDARWLVFAFSSHNIKLTLDQLFPIDTKALKQEIIANAKA